MLIYLFDRNLYKNLLLHHLLSSTMVLVNLLDFMHFIFHNYLYYIFIILHSLLVNLIIILLHYNINMYNLHHNYLLLNTYLLPYLNFVMNDKIITYFTYLILSHYFDCLLLIFFILILIVLKILK